MANTFNFLSNVWQQMQIDFSKNKSLAFILFVLLSIPLSYFINSVFLAILSISTVFYYNKEHYKFRFTLFLPVSLYILMVLSLLWSIDVSNTLPSLSKELSLLIVPLVFMFIGGITENQKQLLLKYYSIGIFGFVVFYLLKAVFRYSTSHDASVFFYHELVTKDVNAIHVSVYVAIAFFYFFTKTIKNAFDYFALVLLFIMVFLLTSKNIIVVFVALMVVYHLFYTKISKQMRLKNLMLFLLFLFSLTFVGKIKDRFKEEYETIMTDSTVNDVISKGSEKVYNVSIKQAWTNRKFQQNDYFPGTAFRVYQFRVFLELLKEDRIFWNGYGLNASYPKIQQKGIEHNIFLGDGTQDGYQTKNFHNQYVQNFAELGVFGFLILIVMLAVNLKNAFKNKDFIHISFAILMISLFLTESFLWRQRGVVFFTTMYCLFNSKNFLLNKTQ